MSENIYKNNNTYIKLFDNILEGCQVIDKQYRYFYANKAVAQQGKTTVDALIGNKMKDVYPGIEKSPLFSKLKECMEKRIIVSIENEFEFPDKSKSWFELRMEPVPEGVFILSLDITERKNNEADQLELDTLKNNFINIVSHQLRTPLSVINWNLEELLSGEEGDISPKILGVLRATYRASKDIITRTNDLIMAMDIEKNSITLKKSPIQISRLVQEVIKETSYIADLKNLKINFNSNNDLPEVNADRNYIKDVIFKLIMNAITYNNSSDGINIELVKAENTIKFSVKDTGIGIPENEQQDIFNRFFRASNAAKIEPDASGLALYMAKKYIEMHNGEIGFNSKEREGSTFWFTLPLDSD